MSTTFGEVKARLKTRFKADDDLSTVQITRGNVFPLKADNDYIQIGDVRTEDDSEFDGLGTDGKDENYIIEIIISVVRSAHEDYDDVEDRALVLFGIIWDSIIDYRTESPAYGGIDGWMKVKVKRSNELWSSDLKERECRIPLDLEVMNRI